MAVVFVGLSGDFEAEGRDRKDLNFPGNQLQLIQAVRAVQPKTVVVLVHGGPLDLGPLVAPGDSSIPAILDVGYPGEMAGSAIVHTLLGRNNPGGKLVTTVYSNAFITERADMANHDLRAGSGITYRWYTGPNSVFPFGWGLSYTQFSYTWAGPRDLPPYPFNTSLAVRVTNTGPVAGDAVLLAFLVRAEATCPLKSLFDFARVSLGPGESQTVTFAAPSQRAVACVNDAGERWLLQGSATIAIGDVVSPATITFAIPTTTQIPTW